MLSRRALVGRLAAGAAVSIAWAAGGVRTRPAWARDKVNEPVGSGLPANDLVPARAASAPVPVQEAAPNIRAPKEVAAQTAEASAPAPWGLLRPLKAGAVVASGWRLADLSPLVDGACVLTLRNARGRTYRVHLCRKDARPQGLVYTDRLELVVMNGGQGDLPTDESLAQAVAAVAHVLAANEGRREHDPLIATLLPHGERLRRFAAADSWQLQ